MKRYHFKVDGQGDAKGVRLASFAAAKCEAAKVAAGAICAAADESLRGSQWTVTVTDDLGLKLLELKIIGTEVTDS